MLNFLGIGAQKAGTTWLYEMLRHHKSILFPAGKEVHFWDANLDKGIAWYDSLFAGEETGKVKGEITPAYAILPPNIISDIYHHYPHLHLIYIIRNPIERAWSSALMALERAEMMIEEASDQWFMDHFMSRGSLLRGDYEDCIRRWRNVFPLEQLLILRYENIANNPNSLLSKCFSHINIDTNVAEYISYEKMKEQIFAGPSYPIRSILIKFLSEIYKPKILSLSEYLKTDFSEWLLVHS
jgi:hypothetical protein